MKVTLMNPLARCLLNPSPLQVLRVSTFCVSVFENATPSSIDRDFGSPYQLLNTREKDYVEIHFILERAIAH